ncbi:MAG: hypothetical protein ABI760_05855 [Ferruginibacter sp.]
MISFIKMFNREKISAFAMLLVAASPLLFFAGFLIRQTILLHEMEERLENGSLQTITVKQADIYWLKKNKEVIIDGKLFDVKSFTITDNKIMLTGIFDVDEDELEKEFAGMMHQKKDNSVPFNQLILKFIFTGVFNKNHALKIPSPAKNIKTFYFDYSEVVVSQSLSVITPPPNL